jgi:hypothetical protein
LGSFGGEVAGSFAMGGPGGVAGRRIKKAAAAAAIATAPPAKAKRRRCRAARSLSFSLFARSATNFVPIALWLLRAYPDGKVVLRQEGSIVPRSGADFDKVRAPSDIQPLYAPLRHDTMREAWESWLLLQPNVRKV